MERTGTGGRHWAEIDHVDGYDVTLKRERSTAREKLWFVNLGGYDGKGFAEQHKNMFVVATSTAEAKAKALRSIEGWTDAHRDDLFEAEKAFALNGMLGERLYVHLAPGLDVRPPRFTCRYTPLK